MIQKSSALYLDLYTFTSRVKNSQSFLSYHSGVCCCWAPLLDATSLQNAYPTTDELVCSAVSEEGVCDSCATFLSPITWHGTTQPSINVCQIQGIHSQKVHLQRPMSWSTLCVWCNGELCASMRPTQPTKPTPQRSREFQLPQRTVSKSRVTFYLRNRSNHKWPMLWNQNTWSYNKNYKDRFYAGLQTTMYRLQSSFSVTKRLFTSTENEQA
jgi:hypothetical protein